jgi:diacylglycerol kinase family enzyme
LDIVKSPVLHPIPGKKKGGTVLVVDVVVNERAGSSNIKLIVDNIKKALYRCDLKFHQPTSATEMKETVRSVIDRGSEYLVICGGDGTLNTALTPIMEARSQGVRIPSICPVRSGTANDFAEEMGTSRNIHVAARAILEGQTQTIDVIEIHGDGCSSYMLTNGGLGVAAETAVAANEIRQSIIKRSDSTHRFLKFYRKAPELFKILGPKIYDILVFSKMYTWKADKWKIEVEIPGQKSFITYAPFVMINNQPSVGGKFRIAPFTSNTDGYFNLMLIEPTQFYSMAKTILNIRFGGLPNAKNTKSKEVSKIILTNRSEEKDLIFFGDGELLHQGIDRLEITCHHPGIPVVTTGALWSV